MSQQLISRSEDLKRLRNEGYNLEITAGHLLVREVPYVTAAKAVRTDGVLVSTLTISGDETATPSGHEVHFVGQEPCDRHGQPLRQIINESRHKALAEGLEVDHMLSSKPTHGYANYYDKMTAYVNILLGPAQALDESVTPRTFPALEDGAEGSVFRYIDSASSRAGIEAITEKLQLSKVAVVGLGGTGSYILDLIAKTPVREIHLFDGDSFLNHNAFRAPGAPTLETLRAKPSKVEYFADVYSNMREGIVAHVENIDTANVAKLDEMEFVFLCLDAGGGKRLATERLERVGVPFIDAGMGIDERNGALGGIIRTTMSTPAHREARRHISLADAGGDDEYGQNIQIAELNSLNAALAVIRWKKHFGFYRDLEHEHQTTYTIDGNQLLNEDQSDAG